MVADVTLISGLAFSLFSFTTLALGAENCLMKPVTRFLIEGIVHYLKGFMLAAWVFILVNPFLNNLCSAVAR